MSEKIKKIWAEDRIKLIVSFISTFAIGLAAHAYGFLNNIFLTIHLTRCMRYCERAKKRLEK